jgi:hypothetical protein
LGARSSSCLGFASLCLANIALEGTEKDDLKSSWNWFTVVLNSCLDFATLTPGRYTFSFQDELGKTANSTLMSDYEIDFSDLIK